MTLEEIKQNIILHYWNGKGSLLEVFWLYGVLANALLVGLFLYPVGQLYPGAFSVKLIFILIVLYNVWSFISIWRCAFNSGLEVWGYLARSLVVFIFLYTLLAFLALSILYLQEGGG